MNNSSGRPPPGGNDLMPKMLVPFSEWHPDVEGAIDIETARRGVTPEATCRRVFIYLTTAPTVAFTMSKSNDLLDDEWIQQTGSIQTDGRWYWRNDLAHYVLKYGIALPGEFIESCESRGWVSSAVSTAALAVVGDSFLALVNSSESII